MKEKKTMEQTALAWVYTTILVVVIGLMIIRTVAIRSNSEEVEPDWPPKMTYAFADENGWCVPGASGTFDHRKYDGPDADRYIPDETAIFGPFDQTPYLEFEVDGTDLVFNTEGLKLCHNYLQGYGHLQEERQYYYGDSIVGLASTLYEDGEIYVAVKFYKTVADSSGKNITIKSERELSDEDSAILHEERGSGLRDYFLTHALENDHIVLRYEEDNLTIVKTEPSGDVALKNPQMSCSRRGNAPVGGE